MKNEPRTPSKSPSPSANEIIALAEAMGYQQRRETVSATLFFKEAAPAFDMPPVLINIYYTTRSIMTYLNHPNSGTNELWRSNAYENLDELRTFFDNPRIHSGKGYRNAKKAVRGCVGCGEMKKRVDFSLNQWKQGPDANKCKDCVASSRWQRSPLKEADSSLHNQQETFPTLTLNNLNQHNTMQKAVEPMERRQFNCPECPKHGRPRFVFFKKVPVAKPICKCPNCKRVTRGNCKRLYPIPKGSEKGYGLYKCDNCGDKWGSSRAVGNVGQQCFTCDENGIESLVVPFRIEVPKKKKYARPGRRIPKEPIQEDQVDEREYGDADRQRHVSGAGNALLNGKGGDGHSDRSYEFVSSNDGASSSGFTVSSFDGETVPTTKRGPPEGYKHKCTGCASGICKNRKIPKSKIHDVSDGNSVSTRASLVTNSSIDKSDYIDRDEDFSGFDLVDEDFLT